PLRVLAEPIAKPISSRLMALPAGFAPPPAIKSIPCEKWRLAWREFRRGDGVAFQMDCESGLAGYKLHQK
ncbi:MAG: hypothetical protein ABSA42_07045, partial [Terracidiphilus sp.]